MQNPVIVVLESDQAGCPIVEGLSQKQGGFSVLNRCSWRQKEQFKQSFGKGFKNGEGMTVLEGFDLSWKKQTTQWCCDQAFDYRTLP